MAREVGVGVEVAEEDSKRGTVSRFGILTRKGMGKKAHGVCRGPHVCTAQGRSKKRYGRVPMTQNIVYLLQNTIHLILRS